LDLSNETPEYYLQAIKDIGPWTDIYALGATIYNLLTDSIPPSKRRLDKEGRRAFSFPSNVSSSTRDLIVWMMKPDKEDRPQSIRSLLIKLSSTEETLVENPIKEANFGSTNQSPKDSNRDKKFNANVLDQNDDSSLWKYVIVALLVGAMAAGYIYYNGSMSNNKPQVEKASYQDYFDK
jgi:serine/threonine protein kinase